MNPSSQKGRNQTRTAAHLTIVFTALAVSRYLYSRTGHTLKRLIRTLKPLQDITINIAGQQITATPTITPDTTEILKRLDH